MMMVPSDAAAQSRSNPWPLGLPSEVTDEYYIHVRCETPPRRSAHAEHRSKHGPPLVIGSGGKWLLFVDRKDVDEVWSKIVNAVKHLRELGFVAKISYKPDSATYEGRYEGSGPVASYHE